MNVEAVSLIFHSSRRRSIVIRGSRRSGSVTRNYSTTNINMHHAYKQSRFRRISRQLAGEQQLTLGDERVRGDPAMTRPVAELDEV